MEETAAKPAGTSGSPAVCPNCGAPAPDRFCAACGQAQRALRVPFRRVVAEALDETISLDSKLARTLPALFLHPGAATRDFMEGRRASHTSPLKLYLLASFAFFLAVAVGPDLRLRVGGSGVKVGAVPAERRHPVETDAKSLAELRDRGAMGRALAEHLEALQRLPPEEAQRRIQEGVVENGARAMFLLVPFMALVLLALHPRRGVYYTEHLVAAVHAQTVTFALLLPGVLVGSGALTLAGLATAAGHLLLAMRRVYATGWAGTAARWLLLAFVYLLAVAFAVAGATLAAVLTR